MYKLFQPVKSKFSLIILSLALIFWVGGIKVIKAQECKISEQKLTNLYTTTLSFQEINSF